MLLAIFLLSPLAELFLHALPQLKELAALLKERPPLTDEQGELRDAWWKYALVLVLLPAVAQELAFRGFILTGLRRRFRPWTAILLSSFLFALFQMNVFELLPHFFLGIVLGLLATRTGSVFPGMLFHAFYRGVFVCAIYLLGGGQVGHGVSLDMAHDLRLLLSVLCVVPAGFLIWRLARQPATPSSTESSTDKPCVPALPSA